MPKRRPIPLEAHAMIEPVVGLLFILAPFILDFDHGSARTLSILVGMVILLSGTSTRWRLLTAWDPGDIRRARDRVPAAPSRCRVDAGRSG